MWFVRALARLLVHVAIGVVVVLAVASLWAWGHGGAFANSFRIACYLFGALMFVFAAAGQQRSYRSVETAGRLPGLPAWMQPTEADRSLTTAATFGLVGIALIALGALLGALT